MAFNFKEQLEWGNIGEQLFHQHYNPTLGIDKIPGRGPDFMVRDSKETIELKSDFYDMDSTRNFFMERWSDNKKKKPGGPWQAEKKGSKFFVYYFPGNGVAYWFYTKKLLDQLHKITKDIKLTTIANRGYITAGFKVPRDSLNPYFVHHNIPKETS